MQSKNILKIIFSYNPEDIMYLWSTDYYIYLDVNPFYYKILRKLCEEGDSLIDNFLKRYNLRINPRLIFSRYSLHKNTIKYLLDNYNCVSYIVPYMIHNNLTLDIFKMLYKRIEHISDDKLNLMFEYCIMKYDRDDILEYLDNCGVADKWIEDNIAIIVQSNTKIKKYITQRYETHSQCCVIS